MIKSTSLDKFAVALSGICILHCLITPIVLTLTPIIAGNLFVEDILFHQLILWLVIPTSSIALFIGCRRHRDLLILGSGILGMAILIIVAFWGHDLVNSLNEKLFTSLGGLALAISHYLNYRACQQLVCKQKNCRSQHHH